MRSGPLRQASAAQTTRAVVWAARRPKSVTHPTCAGAPTQTAPPPIQTSACGASRAPPLQTTKAAQIDAQAVCEPRGGRGGSDRCSGGLSHLGGSDRCSGGLSRGGRLRSMLGRFEPLGVAQISRGVT